MLRTGVEGTGRLDCLATGPGKAQEWGQGARRAALAPGSGEGSWDLSGDPCLTRLGRGRVQLLLLRWSL